MDSGVQFAFISIKREFGGRHTHRDELTASDTHLWPLDSGFFTSCSQEQAQLFGK